jgi:hypothetical protein
MAGRLGPPRCLLAGGPSTSEQSLPGHRRAPAALAPAEQTASGPATGAPDFPFPVKVLILVCQPKKTSASE